jgi:hypothetical protein
MQHANSRIVWVVKLRKTQTSGTNEFANHEKLEKASAVTIKFFIGLLYTSGAILTVVIAAGFVFGVWESMDQNLAAKLPSLR